MKQNLKWIILFCIVLIGIVYVSISLFHKKEEYIYFEGVNALLSNQKYYYTAGSTNNNMSHTEKAKISRYDLKKEKNLEKIYNVGYSSTFSDLILDEDDIVAVGSYEKSEEDHKNKVKRALIVKFDKSGNILFENDFMILENSTYTNIIQVGDYYYVCGQSVYQSTKVGSKEGGALLVKYDKDGNMIWNKIYGNSKNSIYSDLIMVNDFIYVVGFGTNTSVLVQYDMDGNIVHQTEYSTNESNGFQNLLVVQDKIYVCGSILNENNSLDGLIVKYDFDCNPVGEVSYHNTSNNQFKKLIVDEDDYIICVGLSSNKTSDGLIVKYDSNLKLLDSVTYGDENDDYFTDILLDEKEYLVVGYSSYEDEGYMSKFIRYSKALKVLNVE